MGITTYTAARILKGQLQNQSGEETVMTMDTFPYVGLAKVHAHTNIHAHTDAVTRISVWTNMQLPANNRHSFAEKKQISVRLFPLGELFLLTSHDGCIYIYLTVV